MVRVVVLGGPVLVGIHWRAWHGVAHPASVRRVRESMVNRFTDSRQYAI